MGEGLPKVCRSEVPQVLVMAVALLQPAGANRRVDTTNLPEFFFAEQKLGNP